MIPLSSPYTVPSTSFSILNHRNLDYQFLPTFFLFLYSEASCLNFSVFPPWLRNVPPDWSVTPDTKIDNTSTKPPSPASSLKCSIHITMVILSVRVSSSTPPLRKKQGEKKTLFKLLPHCSYPAASPSGLVCWSTCVNSSPSQLRPAWRKSFLSFLSPLLWLTAVSLNSSWPQTTKQQKSYQI